MDAATPFSSTIDLPEARCSGTPPYVGSISPTDVADWLSVNSQLSPYSSSNGRS